MVQDQNRAHPRYALEIDAEVNAGARMIPARTKDMSRGGLCFVATNPPAIGSDVTMKISLVFDEKTMSEPLSLRARVVWCTALGERGHQVGTAFVNLSNEQRSYLDLFLRYLKEGAEKNRPPTPAEVDGDEEIFGR